MVIRRRVPVRYIEELLAACPKDHFLAIRVGRDNYEVRSIRHGSVEIAVMSDVFKQSAVKPIEVTNIEMNNYWYVPKQ